MQSHPQRTPWTPPSTDPHCLVWHEPVDPTEAWNALMRGGWVVAEHVVGSSGGTIVARFGFPPWDGEAVDADEIRVAASRACGASIKALSDQTGWNCSAISVCITNAMRKLKVCSQAELVTLLYDPSRVGPCSSHRPEQLPHASAPRGLRATRVHYGDVDYLIVTYPPARWSLPECLSRTERSIVFDLIAGGSQQSIARARGTAPRTIANQIASIYRKLRVHSRIELFVALRAR